MASRFQTRRDVVEAVGWVGESNCREVFAFVGLDHEHAHGADHSVLFVHGRHVTMTARPGDWLVRDENGITVMRDADFTARYEPTP